MAGIFRNELEVYKCSSNDVINFKLVRHASELEDDKTTFKPEMTHQLFGRRETIFGYTDLRIEMYYTAGLLTPYINMTYSDKITPARFNGLLPDAVLNTIARDVPPGFKTNLSDFNTALKEDKKFKPFGTLMHSYKVISKDNEERHFEIYKTDIEAPGFRDYHERLQTFLLFFVDAASFIDVDDERWDFYLIFEKYKTDGNHMYGTVGLMTIYNYYAYPAKVRPRIGQILILPIFQKQGHGAQLLQTFYNDCYGRKEVLDIAVEDPSESFTRLRDFVDAKNCLKLDNFQPDVLHRGFSEEMCKEAQEKLKISKKQARRVYEILRLRVTDKSNKEQYRSYRLDIKKRLNAPFQKNCRDFAKLKKVLKPEELTDTVGDMSVEQRHLYLAKCFEEHLNVYEHIIERLAVCTM